MKEFHEIQITELPSIKKHIISITDSLRLRNFAIDKDLPCFIYRGPWGGQDITDWRIVFYNDLCLMSRCHEYDKIIIDEVEYK